MEGCLRDGCGVRRHRGGRTSDSTEREDRGYTEQEDTEGGGSATIQREKIDATQNKKVEGVQQTRFHTVWGYASIGAGSSWQQYTKVAIEPQQPEQVSRCQRCTEARGEP